MPNRSRKCPEDVNQLAKCIVDLATMDGDELAALQTRKIKEKTAAAKRAAPHRRPGRTLGERKAN